MRACPVVFPLHMDVGYFVQYVERYVVRRAVHVWTGSNVWEMIDKEILVLSEAPYLLARS